MSAFNKAGLAAIAAAFALVGSAWAAGMPAAGEAPEFNNVTTTSDTTRSAVEAEAAADLPAAGQASAEGEAASSPDPLTRAEVEETVREEAAQDHGFPDASGDERVD